MSKKINKKKNIKGRTEESEFIDINKLEPTEEQDMPNINNNIQISKFTKMKQKRDPEKEEVVEIIKSKRQKNKDKKGMINLEEEIFNFDDEKFIDMKEDLEDDQNFLINFPKNFTKPSKDKILENQYNKILPFSSTSRAGLSLGKSSTDLFNRHFPPIFRGKRIKKIFSNFFNSIL
jgi:hypothetical protein